jgi:hypothetical protein
MHEHSSGLDFVALASSRVSAEVRRESVLHLKRDAPTHHAYAIHGVHNRFAVTREQIATLELNHRLSIGVQ